jgi:hypothetical protein
LYTDAIQKYRVLILCLRSIYIPTAQATSAIADSRQTGLTILSESFLLSLQFLHFNPSTEEAFLHRPNAAEIL